MSESGQAEEMPSTTIDPDELAKFTAMAEDWWNPHGQFKPLHKFNPTRLAYIRDKLCAHFNRDPHADKPLQGLRLLDIGCGGGLLSEPMARLGADVVGADAAEANIKTAALHAEQQGLTIDYRAVTAEQLVVKRETFDAILNMEVIEHVADPQAFMNACGHLMKPDAIMFLATLNRTLKALRWPLSALNMCCAGCRAAPMNGTNSSPRKNWKIWPKKPVWNFLPQPV